MLNLPAVFAFLVTVALAQTPAPVTMAAPNFTSTGVEPALVAAWQDRFVSRLAAPGLRITTSRDIEQMLGLERQKALLGCNEATNCLAELAGALGVELLLTGSIVKGESGYLATVRVLKTGDGRPVASPTARLRSEDALLDWLDSTADELRRELLPEAAPSPVVKWVPAMLGAGLLVGSGVALGLSAGRYAALTGADPPGLGAIAAVRQEGEALQWVGVSLAAAGGVAVVSSLIWAAVAPAPAKSVQVSVAPVQGGALVGLGGAFP